MKNKKKKENGLNAKKETFFLDFKHKKGIKVIYMEKKKEIKKLKICFIILPLKKEKGEDNRKYI